MNVTGSSTDFCCLRAIGASLLLSVATFSTATAQTAREATEAMLSSIGGTLSIQNVPYMAEGRLVGCQLTYEAIVQDWSYRKGQHLKVSGSVAFIVAGQPKRSIGTSVKAVVQEITVMESGQLQFNPAAPDRVYLVAPDFKSNLDSLVAASRSDTPGGVIAFYAASPSLDIVMNGLDANRLTFAFNMAGVETDVQLVVEPDVVDVSQDGKRTRSEKPKAEFYACMRTLLESFEPGND